jgi:hypothetical protein
MSHGAKQVQPDPVVEQQIRLLHDHFGSLRKSAAYIGGVSYGWVGDFVKGKGSHSVTPEIRSAVADAVQRLQAHTATLQSLRPPAKPSPRSTRSTPSPPPPATPLRETPGPYDTADPRHRAALDWLATHPEKLAILLPLLKEMGHQPPE